MANTINGNFSWSDLLKWLDLLATTNNNKPQTETKNNPTFTQPSNELSNGNRTILFAQRNLIDRGPLTENNLRARMEETAAKFNYNGIQGVKGNRFVTPEFIKAVEGVSNRIGTKPEYLMAVMSFETGGTFDPAKRNSIGATGLIQFLPSTAEGLGTTTAKLAKMSPTEQLKYVEKYFDTPSRRGKLGTLEGLYTAVLYGTAKPDSNTTLFRQGTKAYTQNSGLDYNRDGKITAGEATNAVSTRLFGGVRNVQQKLLDAGYVPENLRKNFADGNWGPNTSNVLAKFQRANGINPTGLLDDATGRKLFNINATGPTQPNTPVLLQRGDKNGEVEKLQDNLVKLGHLTEQEKATGPGTFGPRTENAVKEFQTQVKLPANGKFDDAARAAMDNIISGRLKYNQANPINQNNIVKGLQDRLVELGYMTREQVNTGYGTFGPKTEAALKKFQADNNIAQTGVLGATTYKALQNPERTNGGNNTGGISQATNGRYFTVNNGILVSDALKPKLENLAQRYFEQTGNKLHVTSGYRGPDRQASAMYNKIINEGETAVRNLYGNKAAVDEILSAYRANRGNRTAAINAMQRTIEHQVNRGVYISNHLRSNAVDLSANTNGNVLRRIVGQMGGRVINEGDHFHIELPN
jgi:peptidoglycan hydrolase-like protein with peptidoglycan-binding domain